MRDHLWHLELLSRLFVAADQQTFRLTRHVVVDLTDAASMERGTAWWESSRPAEAKAWS